MFTFCFPYMKHTTDKNASSISRGKIFSSFTIEVKSPYENFNGTSPFVVTVLGPPQVGKTTLCNQFRNSFTNIHSKHLFKFSSIPPDIQVSCLIEGEELQLGVNDPFDSLLVIRYCRDERPEVVGVSSPRTKQRRR